YEGEENLRLQLAQEPEVYRLLCGACIELAWCYLRQSPSYELRCFQLTAELLTLLHTRLPWQTLAAEDYANIKQRANRLQSITDYIDQNCQRKLLLAEIAQREDLSLTYLSHFFKDNLGMTFQDYLNRKRLEYACQLLFESDRKILDIALSSGFSDVRYFNEAFRARYGCTPKEWRKGGAVESARLQELNHSTQRICSEQEALQILEPMHRGVREEMKQYTLQQLMS
ncbi:MAG: AraC family transcriptional regulator, partial [Oscillospiraceae bacterium]|nr:AraC family transcriptional regulator [Oscillospiraceae bacterium]